MIIWCKDFEVGYRLKLHFVNWVVLRGQYRSDSYVMGKNKYKKAIITYIEDLTVDHCPVCSLQ